MSIVSNYALLVLDVVNNASLHLKDAIFMQCSYKLLSSVDLILSTRKCTLKYV